MSNKSWYEGRHSLDGCLVLVVMKNGVELRGRMDENGRIPFGKVGYRPLTTGDDQEWHKNWGVKDVHLLEDGKADNHE